MKSKIIVLGTGVCGLSAGHALTHAPNKELDVQLFDKMDRLGGLATSFEKNKFIFDFGPHVFHSHEARVIDFFKEIMRGDCVELPKNVAIKFQNALHRYPLNPLKALLKLPPSVSVQCGLSFLWNALTNHKRQEDLVSSEDFFIKNYGRKLYSIFFENYTHKVWGIHPRDLSAEFIKNRLPNAGLLKMILSSLTRSDIKPKKPGDITFHLQMLYPKKGSIAFPKGMAAAIEANRGKIHLGARAEKIILENGRIKAVRVTRGNQTTEHPCDILVSTMPITELIQSMGGDIPPEVKEAANTLSFRPILIACLLVNKPKIMDHQTIYYTNRVFNRVAQMNSYSPEVSPPGTCGITVELTAHLGDRLWTMPEKELLNEIVADMKKEALLTDSDIREGFIIRSVHGYPVFRLGFEPHLLNLLMFVRGIPNLYTGGRQGMFNYAQMHFGVNSGRMIAEHMLTGGPKPGFSPTAVNDLFFT